MTLSLASGAKPNPAFELFTWGRSDVLRATRDCVHFPESALTAHLVPRAF